uniref:Uncharacterized protein n=1 Tax=Cyanistes caeruleus TaxID=156563 RepID=A0A8C0UYS5_CYACU
SCRGMTCAVFCAAQRRSKAWEAAIQLILWCIPELDDCNLSSSNCQDLSSIINTNPSLTELKLNNNELGDAGCKTAI